MTTPEQEQPIPAAVAGGIRTTDPPEKRRRRLASLRGRLGVALTLAVAALTLTTAAIAMLAVALLTLFRKRRFYTEVMTKRTSQAILRILRVRLVVHRDRPYPERQTIYISNHTSVLDLFILLALGLPNTRYFMRGKFRLVIPLGIINYLIGTFFTPSQRYPAKRVRCFRNAERVLRRTGESVYLSPEGRRVPGGNIGHFNKGTFHLATNLQAPMFPFYIDVPPETNPGLGYAVLPGTVHVYMLPQISTEGWRLEDLRENKQRVRAMFVRFQDGLRGGPRRGPGPGNGRQVP